MASLVYYSNNPAEWTKLEGLYISEETPPGFVQGVDFSIVGMAGKCVKGPTYPLAITSPGRFLEVYGGRSIVDGDPNIDGEIWRALVAKPFGAVVVRRVAAADAVLATRTFSSATTPILRADASSLGSWGNGVTVAIEAASDAVVGHFDVRVTWKGGEKLYKNLDCSAGKNNLPSTLGDDEGNWIVLTKLTDGRPLNASAAALTSGADGAIVNADYTAAVTELASYQDENDLNPSIVLVPEAAPTQSILNGVMAGLAAVASDRVFLVWSGVHGQTPSQEMTAKAAQITTTSPKLVWCFNSAEVLDPATALTIDTGPHVVLASICSQVDVDVHPGSIVVKKFTAGIKALKNQSISRGDLIALRAAGISTLEKLGKSGFRFRTAVSTDGSKFVDVRERIFLTESASEFLQAFVDEQDTDEKVALMIGGLSTFSDRLMKQKRIVRAYNVSAGMTTNADRAEDVEKLLWEVTQIGHMGSIVLVTNIGTGVVIDQAV